jgi:hypothetical protein
VRAPSAVAACFAVVMCVVFPGSVVPLGAQEERVPQPFPSLRAENLLGEEVEIPAGLPGEVQVIFVAFQQRQQPRVNTWLAVADALEADFPGLRYFEFPTIARPYRLMKPIIDNGMRSGIQAEAARARTITVFTNVRRFVEATGLPGTDDIAVFLLDSEGRIRFRDTGVRTEAREAALREAIAEVFGEGQRQGEGGAGPNLPG